MGPLWGAKVPGIAVRNAAFWHDLGLKTVAIPGSVTIIEPFAFDRCERLESEKLSSSLKSILSSTFGSSARLLEIKIPSSVSYVGPLAFRGCDTHLIRCCASAKPEGWDFLWNLDNRP